MKKIENKYFSYSVYSDGSGALYYGKDGKYWEYIVEYGNHQQKINNVKLDIKNKEKEILYKKQELKNIKNMLAAIEKINIKKIPSDNEE